MSEVGSGQESRLVPVMLYWVRDRQAEDEYCIGLNFAESSMLSLHYGQRRAVSRPSATADTVGTPVCLSASPDEDRHISRIARVADGVCALKLELLVWHISESA